jgi:broad specificity polyphosphatase/5'/3'-nucleotidase SurE
MGRTNVTTTGPVATAPESNAMGIKSRGLSIAKANISK